MTTKSKRLTYAAMTKYPKLFSKTYWGNFGQDPHPCLPEILAARNQLVEDFELTKVVQRYPGGLIPVTRQFDHMEVYRTRAGGVLFLVSPYEDGEALLQWGFTHYVPCIYEGATTYYRRFDNVRAYGKWARGYGL